jgi:hypothetical protein
VTTQTFSDIQAHPVAGLSVRDTAGTTQIYIGSKPSFPNAFSLSPGVTAVESSGGTDLISALMSGTYNGRIVEALNSSPTATEDLIWANAFGPNAAIRGQTTGSNAGSYGGHFTASNINATALYVRHSQAAGNALEVNNGNVQITSGSLDVDAGDINMGGGDIVVTGGSIVAAPTSGSNQIVDINASGTHNARLLDIQQANTSATQTALFVSNAGTGPAVYGSAGNVAGDSDGAGVYGRSAHSTRPAITANNTSGGIGIYITQGELRNDYYMTMLDWGDIDLVTPPSGYARFFVNSDEAPSGEIEPYFINASGTKYSLKPSLPTSYIHDYRLEVSIAEPLTQVVLGIGAAKSSDGSTDMTTGTTIPLSLAYVGVNGLDASTEQASTWYYAWVIHNPTTSVTQGLISTSTTSPVMPSGYTKKLRVGTFRNDASSNIIPFRQGGTQHDRTYILMSSFSSRNVLTGGSAETSTQVDVSGFVPPVSFSADLTCTNLSGTRTVSYQEVSGGIVIMEIIEGTTSYSNAPLGTDQSFWYLTDGASGDFNVWVRGWRENL